MSKGKRQREKAVKANAEIAVVHGAAVHPPTPPSPAAPGSTEGKPGRAPTRARRVARPARGSTTSTGAKDRTTEKLGQVLELLAKGYSQRHACTEAKLSRSTFHDLLKDPEVAPVIQAAIDQGLGELEHRVYEAAGMGDWRAAARLLEQRDPRSWSAKAQIELAGKVEVDAQVGVVRPDPVLQAMERDPEKAEVLRAFLDAYASIRPDEGAL